MLKNYWWDSRREPLFQYLETTNVIHELQVQENLKILPSITQIYSFGSLQNEEDLGIFSRK